MYVCMYIESHIEASWMKVVKHTLFYSSLPPSILPYLAASAHPSSHLPLLSPTLSPSIYMHLRSAGYSTVGISKL